MATVLDRAGLNRVLGSITWLATQENKKGMVDSVVALDFSTHKFVLVNTLMSFGRKMKMAVRNPFIFKVAARLVYFVY